MASNEVHDRLLRDAIHDEAKCHPNRESAQDQQWFLDQQGGREITL